MKLSVLGFEQQMNEARAEGYAAGHAQGQRDMMDKVLRMCFDKNLTVFADYIRALPINPPPVLSTGEGPAESGKEKVGDTFNEYP